MYFSVVAITAFAALASAYTQPTTLSGNNAISLPSSKMVLEVGKEFVVTWTPDHGKTITLLLLNGCPSNCKVVYPIVEKYTNSGKYPWTPKADLKSSAGGYGIQIVTDSDGLYQYSPEFGIKNSAPVSSTTPASSKVLSSTAYDTTSTSVVVSVITMTSSGYPPGVTETPKYPNSTMTTSTTSGAAGTGSTTRSATSTSASAPAQSTNAAVGLKPLSFAGAGLLAFLGLVL